MRKEYMDISPKEIEESLEKLTDYERTIFDKGYAIALVGVLEQITETKDRLFSKVMDLDEDQEDYRKQLLSRVHILDVYEKHYSRRVKNMSSIPA